MQTDLFAETEDAGAIPGLRYEPAFLSSGEEAHLLEVIKTLPTRCGSMRTTTVVRNRLRIGPGAFAYLFADN